MAKLGETAAMTVPMMKHRVANSNRCRSLNRRCRNAESGVIIATTSRLPVVSHCTVPVDTEKVFITAGKAMLLAVSVIRPQNDTRHDATTESDSFVGT